MAKYSVHKAVGSNRVIIALDGYGPSDTEGFGFEPIGSFEHGADEQTAQLSASELTSKNGDHPLVVKAREVVLEHLGDENADTRNWVFEDRASNANVHSEDVGGIDELTESEPATAPDASSQKGGRDSALDAAADNDGKTGDGEQADQAAVENRSSAANAGATEPNAKTLANERQDAGKGEQQVSSEKTPNASKGGVAADPVKDAADQKKANEIAEDEKKNK